MKHFKRARPATTRASRQAANEDLPPTSSDLLSLAKKIIAIRFDRTHYLSAALLGEPGYDLMLAMFIVCDGGVSMRAGDLELAVGVPPSTAVRWTKALEELGLITQIPDRVDVDDRFLTLTPRGHAQVRSHLESAWRAFQA